MIEIIGLKKSFREIEAVNDISLTIGDQEVFGIIGTNGAGKSTLLRMMAGVYKPDAGCVLIDKMPVYDNVEVKRKLFFIADDPYYFPNGTAEDMGRYYATIYEDFDSQMFAKYLRDFGLDPQRKIAYYSKGMLKQLSIIIGVCAKTKYLLCDETFDGLDPVMRQGVKSIFAKEMEERGLTPIIASHNLRELEDICDHVGLLHEGGVLLSKDIESMKLNIQKVQCVYENEEEIDDSFGGLYVMKHELRGRLHTVIVRGTREEVKAHFEQSKMLFFEILPLTLEEIFISETEVVGYDVKKFILG